jgi:trigger factor
MPKIERHDIDALNLSLTVTLEKEEVKKKFNSELNKFRQKASIKGFRPGKTPEMVIKRMYGESLFSEIIQNLLNGSISEFMEESKFSFLGQPIPSEDTPPNANVNFNKIDDMIFKFDMGAAPDVEPKGVDASDTYTKIVPEIPNDWIEEAILSDRKRMGERLLVEDLIQDNDVVKIAAKEVAGTHESSFSVLVDMLTEDAQDVFKQHKKGDSFQMNIHHLEKDSTEEKVRKYFLLLEDDTTKVGEMFHLTIEEVTRVTVAEMNEDYFTKSYGPTVTNEEQAKEFIKGEYTKHFETDSFGLMVRDIQRELIAKNADITLPDAFLKRWLLIANSNNTEELIEKEYEGFATSLRWDLTREAISKKFDIQVTEDDILNVFKEKARKMYGDGQYGNEIVNMLAEHIMKDIKAKNKKEYNEAVDEARYVRFFNAVAENITIDTKVVTVDEFNSIRQEAINQATKERETPISMLENNLDEVEYEEIVD